ncbi:PocR ligand-binding domain-containing protein [Clostridium sp. CM027]|uniref:PocR ligand-binding domain-containing protein n=1 Tax=Clostridium sp. CM027 TaxID=2849865 RepID=UPI001C6EFD8B|nr:PocR ligand-binding domain-containing protein [Clostridium sp. CM027]MBW9145823.1 PocR ligand-binding domain-containing protein [Clostridium sp. CM027]UVE42113.1 PocR ligand-binding domain-containing protein [Clostridium sp. CM027]
MRNGFLHLDNIINVDNFQKIQDNIAEVTGIAMVTVDYKGKRITSHSKCSEFCKFVRLHLDVGHLCEKCDARGGLEAARLQRPYLYICHVGVIDLAIPIVIDGQYFGAVMAGQVIIKDEEKEDLEQIVNNKYFNMELEKEGELKVLYEKLPMMTLDRVKSVANMIFHISNYIVEEALLKITSNKHNDKILTVGSFKTTNLQFKKANKVKTVEENLKNNVNLDFSEDKNNIKCENKCDIILKPALDYIQKNYRYAITLNGMASLCNISPSYFSKLFKKCIGDNFSSYINKVRIKKAKELLEASDVPISNLALDLGFEDCGYFIKVFKRIEGVTPAVYRDEYNVEK